MSRSLADGAVTATCSRQSTACGSLCLPHHLPAMVVVMIAQHSSASSAKVLSSLAALLMLCLSRSALTQESSSTAKSAASDATLSQAQHSLQAGHPEDTLRLTELLPPQPGRVRLRGEALYALGRLQEADKELAKASAEDPKDLAAIQLRGLVLYRLGRPADAIPLLQQAHSWGPETRSDPAYVLALCYIDTRRFDDARHAFADQYGFAPDGAPARLLTARMLLRREYVPVAQEEARKALQLDPSLPLAHRLLGEVALAGNHLDEAAKEFEQERQRNPLDGTTYDRLGDVYTRSGDYPKAQQMLQRALLLEPTSTGPYILLGKVLLKRQDAASAAGYLERAEKMDPANYMTHSLLGQAYRGMGRLEEARKQADISQKLQADTEPKLQSVQ